MKGEKDEPEHVEGSEQRGEQAEGVEDAAAALALIGVEQDGILAEESGERRKAGDGQRGGEHGEVGPADFFAEAAHALHVLLAADGVNDAAGSEKEHGLEESVGHEVEDAGGKRGDPASKEHVAELADGGISEDAIDVGLHQADGGGEERGGAADDGDDEHGGGRVREKNMRARDDVNAGGDHSGGVD